MTWPMLLCVVGEDAERSGAGAQGASALDAVVEQLGLALPGVHIELVATDADGALLEAAIARVAHVPSGLAAVIAPLVLAEADAIERVAMRLATARPDVMATAAWGKDAHIVTALLGRLAEAGVAADSTVVLAATCDAEGESPPFAATVAEALRGAWGGPVRVAAVGDGAAGLDKVSAAVRAARAYGEEGAVAVAALVLLPGEDHGALSRVSADAVTAPLAPHPAIAAMIADKYAALVHANPRDSAST